MNYKLSFKYEWKNINAKYSFYYCLNIFKTIAGEILNLITLIRMTDTTTNNLNKIKNAFQQQGKDKVY